MGVKVIPKKVVEHTIFIIALILYRILLDIVYVRYISPTYFYYMGLQTDIKTVNVVVSYALTIIVLLVAVCSDRYLSEVLLNVQLVVMLMPMLSLFAMSGRSMTFTIVVCIAHILQSLIVKIVHRIELNKSKLQLVQSGKWLVITIVVLIIVSFIYTYHRYGRASLAAFDLMAVYDIRENVGYSFPFSYLVPWTFKIVCLFAFVVFLEQRKYLLALLASLMQIYFYLVYANKATLFSWILVFASYLLMKKININKGMVIGLLAVMIGSSGLYIITGNIMPLSLLVRRVLFVPARIKFAYFEFFSNNILLHLADSRIGQLLGMEYPYEIVPPKLIAKYLGVPNSYCNTGYWGDAFANFGLIGVIIFSFILILLILLIEKMNINKRITYPLMIAMFYSLNDGGMMTWLLGGGGILMIVLLWLYRNYDNRLSSYEAI